MSRAVVVFESMWGNTEKIARAVARGLGESMDVEVDDVASRPAPPGDDVALLVAGGPTHAFSMTRRGTRTDARTRGASQGDVEVGLREWLDALPDGRHPQRVATFDTRVDTVRHVPGSAARGAARKARRHGYPTGASQSFWVGDSAGPLLEGELERAAEWGRRLAAGIR